MKKNNIKKKILYIAQVKPDGFSGTSLRTKENIDAIVKSGYQVDICYTVHQNLEKNISGKKINYYQASTNRKKQLNFKLIQKIWLYFFKQYPLISVKMFNPKLKELISILLDNYTYEKVLFEGFTMMQYASQFDERYCLVDDENIPQIIRSRADEEPNLLKKTFYYFESYKSYLYRKKFLKNFGEIWAISKTNAKVFKSNFDKKIKVMPTVVNFIKNVYQEKSENLVYTGTLDWPDNVRGLKWFLNRIWPFILESKPKLQLIIAGKGGDDEIAKYFESQPNVVYLGFVQNLEKLYAKSALAICPVFVNQGIKMKILTYLRYGIPTISPKVATLGLQSTKGVVITTKENMANDILKTLDNLKLRKKLSIEAQQNIELNHSTQSMKKFIFK